MADAVPNQLGKSVTAEEDAKNSNSNPSLRAKEANSLAPPTEQEDLTGHGLSPMRTHEQDGYDFSLADRVSHLVEESEEEDEGRVEEKDVNHEKLERKELRRQKTNDKPNRMRDRLKRTVSKTVT